MTAPALARLADFVAKDALRPDQPTLDMLRDGVIDALGCIHAGAGTEVATRCRMAVAQMGAEGGSPVIGWSQRASRPQAAFLNAVAGHALDFDDWEIPGNTHPTVVLLPALLAVTEAQTQGRVLAQAYLAGFEVIARLGEALNFDHYDAGWHSTATLGAIGAAAGCARLMGLDAPATMRAMSLACSAASGYTCQFGSQAKPVQAGFAARAGVEAACLAKAGVTAQPHALDHPRGFAALMGGRPADRLSLALSKLGQSYALGEHGLVLKPWPSCGYTHRLMTCALSLRDRIRTEDISHVILHMPDFHAAVLPFATPTTRSEALFSAPFVAAMGFVHGDLTLADLDRKAWCLPDIAALMTRCVIRPFSPKRPDLNYSPDDPDRFEVILRSGARVEERCVYPMGAPQAPMSKERLVTKFTSNLGLRTRPRVPSAAWLERLLNWTSAPEILDLFFDEGVSA